ncbi:S9 family peptidase [Christiangramia sediminis]|uniref:S9 family peptidase n=1 Tax=Christiangramia sediminis TaxID=2881336 RepID=A0A9X1LLC8_9FLAO|nr:S9 family peptidase [Christiangramia sediminis]MCB7482458.1 S9 family peptidase [Christiangramia sediminis]
MKNLYLFAFLVFLSTSVLSQEKSELQLLDIFDYEYVSDPQISPDGSKVIYVRNFKDIMTDQNLSNLWIVNADGSQNRPLTSGNQNDMNPRWSKDGKKIIFLSNKQDDKMKLYLMWLDSRDTFPLTNTKNTPGNISWSNNGENLVFTMFVPKKSESFIKLPAKPEGAKWNDAPKFIDELNYRGDGQGYLKEGNKQIFMLSTDGGSPRQLTFSDHDHNSPVWSADDKKIFFSANLHDNADLEPLNSEIYELDLEDLEVNPLTNRNGPDSDPVVSPNDNTIAYLGFDDEYLGYNINKLYVLAPDGSGPELISGDFDRSIQNIQWDARAKGLYFQYDDHGKTRIGYMDLKGNTKVLTNDLGGLSLGRPYNAASFSVSKNGDLAYTLGTAEHPADLAVQNGKRSIRITNLNKDLFSYRNLGKVEEITWKSSFDDREMQGWLVTPPNFDPNKKYPFILEIHGGPFASYGSVFSAEIQAFAAAGYVVLYSNPRGSSGYGKEFGNLIHHDYPNHDYEDLMSGVDAAIAKGFIDEENLFVTGGSGGGVLTAWIVGKTDRFKAAVVAKPVINWTSFVLYADNPAFFSKYWFENKPWEDPEPYLKRSPLTYVGNVTTPTMLLTGEEDYRTPIAESEQFYTALKLEGVESAMVRIPGASHGIANKPSNLIAKIAAILAWFEKYRE